MVRRQMTLEKLQRQVNDQLIHDMFNHSHSSALPGTPSSMFEEGLLDSVGLSTSNKDSVSKKPSIDIASKPKQSTGWWSWKVPTFRKGSESASEQFHNIMSPSSRTAHHIHFFFCSALALNVSVYQVDTFDLTSL